MRYGILAANVALLLVAVGFVTKTPAGHNTAQPTTNSTLAANAVDQVSSANIAVHVARMTGLDESTAVVNHADSVSAQLAVVTSNDTVVSKPQVVTTDLKSRRDIISYTVQEGETVSALATRFIVTSDSIRWSNGISGENIAAGKVLYVLPGVSGIIYRVVAGDTVDSLATRFQGNKDQMVAFNDAENGLPVGQNVIIPGGLPVSVAKPVSRTTPTSNNAFAFGGAAIYGSNGYDYGWCTWYVASKISVPNNWGNAGSWAFYAPSSGWNVSSTPRAGAIAQSRSGWAGHVGIVEAVSEDGTMIKYSDMNGLAGFGRVGYSDWEPANSKFQNFIYR